ncbi:unnamed protein product [Urochloa decumbens]|uniref:RING-type E3 ubiquitin transferase n=1 Tax=Urochloa decumbens TaxID=240449 RepID=A0ABC8XAU5_9POAL
MDADGGGAAPAPAASHGPGVSHRASSALAGVSVFLILLCLFCRFIWQCLKHEGRSAPTGAGTATVSSSSSPPPPSCPSQDGTAANGAAGEAAARRATTSRLPPVFVRVAAAAGSSGAEKVDCAVCLAEIGDSEAATRLVPGCGHGFHAECIEAWFRVNSTCPLCRAAVDAPAAAGQGAREAPQYCSSV